MEVTLTQILQAREKRAQKQQELLEKFGESLICFTMNIPGPIKDSPLIREGFRLGEGLLFSQLEGSGISIIYREQELSVTGCQGFYVVKAAPLELKGLLCQVEDSAPVARLYDMDVLTPEDKVGREELGLSPRKCLICHRDAWVCSRSRAHDVDQLQKTANRLLKEAVQQNLAQKIAATAVQSLLWEVCITPKPGLVDRLGSGSHADMDIFTFTASAPALQPYFEHCAKVGMDTCDLSPEDTLQQLRLPGKVAEKIMLDATGGVNTHKGAIFSLGILCAAAGRTGSREPDRLLAECAAMCRNVPQELGKTTATKGQALYAQYGIQGVRGQAAAGFPGAKTGLTVLRRGLDMGLSLNHAGCAALLHILVNTQDTSLLSRSTPEICRDALEEVAALLRREPYPSREALERLDRDFTQKNLSPGGSADLLALSLFLQLYCR